MRKTPAIAAALFAVALVAAMPAQGEEQTRETYVAQVEPICQANRETNERIMSGARDRVNKGKLDLAGKQFVRVSRSFGGLVERIASVPPPATDSHRVERWLELMRLLESRLRTVGRYFKAGEKIKATHESILAERAGISANNISIVFHFKYCRLSRFG